MKYSIRFKLFIGLGCLVVFFVALSWMLNSLFLEKYYLYNKKSTLRDSFKIIDELYRGDTDEVYLELEKLERMKGVHIVIMDKEFDIVYNSMQKEFSLWPRLRSRGLRDMQNLPDHIIRSMAEEIKIKGTVITNMQDKRMNSNFVTLFSSLYNGDYIVLSAPVAAIEESVNIANDFFIFTGIITLLIGCILIFVITGKFTKPILQLNSIAQRMSTLDFSKRYPVKTGDEIGQLGHSINSLSEQLEKSITELRDANEMLKEDIERKKKIDEMRKEFISSVSHELKTPIALVQGYAEGLKVNVNEDEDNKNFYCDVIVDEAGKMNKLVKQLLELAQIEAGELFLDKSEFNILELIGQVIKKNELIFREKSISLSIEKNEAFVVNADYDRVEQVLTNYLTNALNHVDDKRIIKIRIFRSKSKGIISVFNSGKHIPEQYADKIWASFYKIDKARTREYGGTGLGLSIVRAIQQAHRNGYGFENVESGVEFWFNLDLAE